MNADEINVGAADGAAETKKLTPAKYRAHLREMSRLLMESHAVLHAAGNDLIENAGMLHRKAEEKEGVIQDVRAIARKLRCQADKMDAVAGVLEQTEQA